MITLFLQGSSGFIERVACWNIKNRTCVWIFDWLVWLLEVCSFAEKKLHLYVVELWRRPSILRQSKKDYMCDKVTLKALMLQRDVCVISYSYASLLKVSCEILSSLKPSGHSLTSLIPSVLRAKKKMRSCKMNQRSCRPVKFLFWSTPTLPVLGTSDVVLTVGVQNPKDGVKVIIAEQIWSWTATPLGNLQLLQLFHQKCSWILLNTQRQLYSLTSWLFKHHLLNELFRWPNVM